MIETMLFGRTGHRSSRIIFGAAAFWGASQFEADRALELLESYGVNHIDTARSYGDAELRIGPWMKHRRKSFFLATKTKKRTRTEALQELSESLDRLQTDHVDLWQIHSLTNEHDWEKAFGEGGVLEAALEAKQQGLIKYIGVTGHGTDAPRMHMRSLERFSFDSVLFPMNYPMLQHKNYARDVKQLIEACTERHTAVQTIKSLARRDKGDRDIPYTTWYEPLEDQEAIRTAVHWVLGDRRVFLISAGELTLLPHILQAAVTYRDRPDDSRMDFLMQKWTMSSLGWWP